MRFHCSSARFCQMWSSIQPNTAHVRADMARTVPPVLRLSTLTTTRPPRLAWTVGALREIKASLAGQPVDQLHSGNTTLALSGTPCEEGGAAASVLQAAIGPHPRHMPLCSHARRLTVQTPPPGLSRRRTGRPSPLFMARCRNRRDWQPQPAGCSHGPAARLAGLKSPARRAARPYCAVCRLSVLRFASVPPSAGCSVPTAPAFSVPSRPIGGPR